MPLRKMNIDRNLIISEAKKVSKERKFGYYRWMIRICKAFLKNEV
jgi:5-methylcytosine-specific restriction endonuclease McrBC regulatory subunit McrC